MPRLLAVIGAVLVLGGCDASQAPRDHAPPHAAAHGGYGHHGPHTKAERLADWEEKWVDAKREVVEARATAIASARPIPAAVETDVEDLLDRNLEGETAEDRILLLQDAVSDALRLASLLEIG